MATTLTSNLHSVSIASESAFQELSLSLFISEQRVELFS